MTSQNQVPVRVAIVGAACSAYRQRYRICLRDGKPWLREYDDA